MQIVTAGDTVGVRSDSFAAVKLEVESWTLTVECSSLACCSFCSTKWCFRVVGCPIFCAA